MPKALIIGIAGTRVGARELTFIREADPLGFILFGRNIAAREQVIALVEELRGAVGRADAPVLIDQEGGTVARLRPPQWRAAPAAETFGTLLRLNREHALRAATLNAQLIGAELAALGISVDCAPVADVPVAEAHPIIGDRAFATEPEAVSTLASAFCDGLDAAGILPVIKHIPGHGRATLDSHKDLPRVTAARTALAGHDFPPFKTLGQRTGPQPWAMTAHVVYECIDGMAPATLSRTVIADVIRGDIGFDGVIISDDLSMGALTGPFEERAGRALSAGCDLALHCNGNLEEMTSVAAGCAPIGMETTLRLELSLGARRPPAAFDSAAALAELDVLISAARGAA